MEEFELKKEYNLFIKKIVKDNLNPSFLQFSKLCGKKVETRDYFNRCVKKSTFLANILPSIVFLIISLISFSMLFINDSNSNLGVALQNSNLRIAIMCFSVFFIVISIILSIRRIIFKIRVIEVEMYGHKGYVQLSNKKYLEILNIIEEYL